MKINPTARKGFYFSFDALLALTVMSASLFVVMQSSDTTNDVYKAQTITYQKSNLVGQDAMKLASATTFRDAFGKSFENELVDQTVMNEEDLNRTIIDGIGLLWAARNFTYANESARKYFRNKVPSEYGFRLQVNGSGNGIIYNSGSVPKDSEAVSSVSRLVSGHKIDKPSEGFQARARATSVVKNQTKAFSISSQGGSRFGGKLEIRRTFNITGSKVWNGTLFLTPHYGCNEANFEQLKVNGNQITSDIKWIEEEESCSSTYDTGTGALGYLDITPYISKGENTIYIRFRNDEYNAHLHPGMRARIKYSSEKVRVENLEHKTVYFSDMETEEKSNNNVGAFAVKSYQIPEDATIKNVTLHVNASGIDRQYSGDLYDEGTYDGYCQQTKDGGYYYVGDVWDFRIYHNSTLIDRGLGPSDGTMNREYDLTDQTKKGTNLVSMYFNWEGDCAWSEDNVEINSDFESRNSTRIDVWYETPPDQLEFGKIDVTTSEFIGTSGNPVTYSKDFGYDELESSYILPTQLSGAEINITAWNNGNPENEVFDSPAARSVPSSLYIDPVNFNTDNTNYVKLWDSNPDNDFLEKTAFQYTQSVPSQVGYGDLYPNKSFAVDDAQERLEDLLGPFVDATGISDETVSTGDQPYIWGPASMKLVIWRE